MLTNSNKTMVNHAVTDSELKKEKFSAPDLNAQYSTGAGYRARLSLYATTAPHWQDIEAVRRCRVNVDSQSGLHKVILLCFGTE